MAGLIFSIEKVLIDDVNTTGTGWTDAVDLGVTKGGGSFTQDVTSLEIMSDQASDPEAIVATQATKTITLNLLDATPSNLALAFGGAVDAVDTNKVTIPSLVTGTEKAVKITTRKVNNVQYEIEIPRALIKGNSTITFSNDDASSIPIEITVLTPTSGSPVTITKK